MRRTKPNMLIMLTIAFGLFLVFSGTSQLVQKDRVIQNAQAATLYTLPAEK